MTLELAIGLVFSLGRRAGRTALSRELASVTTTGARCIDGGGARSLFGAGGVGDDSPMRGRVAMLDAGASCVIRHRRWRWR